MESQAAKIHCALLPLLTHYKGMLADCKQGLQWLVCGSIFLILVILKHNFPPYIQYSGGEHGTFQVLVVCAITEEQGEYKVYEEAETMPNIYTPTQGPACRGKPSPL